MGSDELEHEPGPIRAPISKRKAPVDGSVSARKPHKLPRLDLNGSTGAARPSSSSPSPSSRDEGHASRTPPVPTSLAQKKKGVPERPRASQTQRARKQSTNSGKIREQNGATSSRREQPATARKRTAQAKNFRKVTTEKLLRDAQNPSTSSFVDDRFTVLIHRVLRASPVLFAHRAISCECVSTQVTRGTNRLHGRVSDAIGNVCPRTTSSGLRLTCLLPL